jgi:hypothetical protein
VTGVTSIDYFPEELGSQSFAVTAWSIDHQNESMTDEAKT